MTPEDKAAFNNWWQSTGGGRIGEKLQAEHAVKWALEYARQQSTNPVQPAAEVLPTYADQCQAEGWKAVSKTLDEVSPGWIKKSKSGMEAACNAIRELAQNSAPASGLNAHLLTVIKEANNQAEHFEREWYLRGDELEALQKVNAQLLAALEDLVTRIEDWEKSVKRIIGSNVGHGMDVSKAKEAIAAAEAAKGV